MQAPASANQQTRHSKTPVDDRGGGPRVNLVLHVDQKVEYNNTKRNEDDEEGGIFRRLTK